MVTCGGPPRLEKRAVDLHESKLRSYAFDGATLRARLDAYVHQSLGEPGVDAGTGWSQEVDLVLERSSLQERPRELPLWITSGAPALLPLPYAADGECKLRLSGGEGALGALGARLSVEAVGEPRFVERVAARPKAVVSWSSGKDSAFACHRARKQFRVTGLLTTITSAFDRVSMHGVRNSLLDQQLAALGLPCRRIGIPSPCTNQIYQREFALALLEAKSAGVTHVIFGDLFLQEIRDYREQQLSAHGLTGVYPLWKIDTSKLAREMIEEGLRAVVTCVDPRKLPASFAGRVFDEQFLRDLPAGVDPCGENGEFHTFVTGSPSFEKPIQVTRGEVVERDGFVFADFH